MTFSRSANLPSTTCVMRTRARSAGFTLVELLIVVVILGILAALAGVGYRRYVGRARSAEASVMLAEVVSREMLYYQEFGQFLPMRNDGKRTVGAVGTDQATADEAVAAFYPVNPNNAFDSVRTPTSVATVASRPLQWRQLGVNPKDSSLYCTYFANAGVRNTIPAPAGSHGAKMLGTTAVTAPWWYVLGACNLNGTTGGLTNDVSVFAMSSATPSMVIFNENR